MEEARVLETLKVIGFNPSNPDRSVYHRRLFLAQEAWGSKRRRKPPRAYGAKAIRKAAM